ncbi:MAG: acetoacetate--CoA ligase [Chromatiales bacterium]|nr:MAG: acetoacetate--CoA ligase [Chromatiales bacterium]
MFALGEHNSPGREPGRRLLNAGEYTGTELWRPGRERAEASRMWQFMAFAQARGAPAGDDYDRLHRWSVDEPAAFWGLLAEFLEIEFTAPPRAVLEHGDRMPGAKWFPGAELNFAAQLLRGDDERPAIVFRDEAGRRCELSFRELRRDVAAIAEGLRRAGVRPGDRVAGYLPNCPEAVIAMLATTSLGAVWSSASPDFGVNGAVDRFGQIGPRVLFTADGYRYAGKVFDCLDVAAGLETRVASIEQVVVVPFLADAPDLSALNAAVAWQAFGVPGATPQFKPMPFDHPVYILYSSGTTGRPKCIVHGAGGTLLQHRKEHALHTDIGPDDRLFFFTTCGWMMWNWLVSGLASGAAIVLYDGSPFEAGAGVLWRMAEEEGVTVFGVSAKYLSALEKSGYRPKDKCRLQSLRTVLSTGSPLAPAGFDFVYEAVADDVQLSSISGGTDLIACFALGNPMLPVRRGELQCLALGMAVDIYDDDGTPLPRGCGELVCTRPFPSMPVGFWGDETGAHYRAAYFERFPGVWAHGDFAEFTEHRGLIIHGRSDAVLNPGGVRIGTAEIYRQVEQLDAVLESLAVCQDWDGDQRIVLFVVLRAGAQLDDALRGAISNSIRSGASPRHVPAKIIAVPDLPRTKSGKITELAVRDVIHDREVTNTDALANPGALAHFRGLPELER